MEKENKREFGAAGEKIALNFLKENGYTVLKCNYRVGRIGEVDIIAREKDYICFVEVKTRRNISFGLPSESVNHRKQQNITRLAQIFLSQNKLTDRNVRFDVVEIIYSGSNSNSFSINLIKNAF